MDGEYLGEKLLQAPFTHPQLSGTPRAFNNFGATDLSLRSKLYIESQTSGFTCTDNSQPDPTMVPGSIFSWSRATNLTRVHVQKVCEA